MSYLFWDRETGMQLHPNQVRPLLFSESQTPNNVVLNLGPSYPKAERLKSFATQSRRRDFGATTPPTPQTPRTLQQFPLLPVSPCEKSCDIETSALPHS